MKQITASVIAMILALPVIAKTEYTVQPVADITTAGRVWDLTQCEPVGDEYDYTVDAGSARTRVWSPVKRFDFFMTPGDTVWQTCAETRAYRTLFTPGILNRLPDAATGSSAFTFKGRIYQSEFVIGDGVATVHAPVKGVTMSWPADTIGGVALHHNVCTMRWTVSSDSLLQFSAVADSLIFTTTVDTYCWMAPGEQFPRAFKRVDRVSNGGEVVGCDSAAWVLTLTPSMVTDRARRALLPGGDNRDNDGRPIPGMPGGCPVTVNVDADCVTIATTLDAGMGATVVITDVLGRLYHESAMALTPAGVSLPMGGWPRGEYLLQVIPDDGSDVIVNKFAKK